MRMPWRRRTTSSVLSGAVCTIHIIIKNVDSESEDQVLRGLWHPFSDLRSEILATTHQVLGPEFDIRSMSLARGSIEIFVTIGAIYYAMSRYKNFVESIELLATQLTGVVRRLLDPMINQPISTISIWATWEPGPGLIRLEVEDHPSPVNGFWAYPLLWYVIVTHAALLTLLIWLFARR